MSTEYTFSLSGYGFGNDTHPTAGDTIGNKNVQTVLGTSMGELLALDYSKSHDFFLKDLSQVGYPIQSLEVTAPLDKVPNGIIAGVSKYAVLYEWSDGHYAQQSKTRYLGNGVLDIHSSDINSDGKEEILISTEESGVKIYQKENSTLKEIWERKPQSSTKTALGDVDGDGQREMVFIDSSESSMPKITVLRMRANDTIVELEDNLPQRISGVVLAADVDNDGQDEIIVAGPRERRFSVFKITDNRLTRQYTSNAFSETIVGLQAGDVSGENITDLVIATSNEVTIFRWNGNTFVKVQTIDSPHRIFKLIVRDNNFDGRDEIIISTRDGRFFVLHPRRTARSQFLTRETIRIPRRLPDARKILRVEVDRIRINDVDRFSSGVIVRGSFFVQVLYSARPDNRVISFSTRIPFSVIIRTPQVFRPISRRNIDIDVEFVDSRFNPKRPRELTVIIIARVTIFNRILSRPYKVPDLSREAGIPENLITELNNLDYDDNVPKGHKLLIP